MHVNLDVQATILGNPDIHHRCRLVDISHSGACLILPVAVSGDRLIKIEWSQHFLIGRPRHIKRVNGGYQIGLQLLACSRWKDSDHPALNTSNVAGLTFANAIAGS